MFYLDVEKKIDRLREKMYKSIEENGLDSEETRKLSLKIDELINVYYKENKKYPEDNTMLKEYKKACEKLILVTREFGEFPKVDAWNQYAKKYGYLSSVSIEYISGLNWHKLRDKILSKK